jgi:hypothetical protein
MKIITIKKGEADKLLEHEHYLGRIGYHPKFCLTTEQLDALAVYSPPIPQHFKVKLPGCLELIRLWQSDARRARRQADGPLSVFLKASLQWLRENDPNCPCVFSYTDPSNIYNGKPNHGAVYQAARFKYLGESRITDYWEREGVRYSSPVMYRRHKTKSREKLQALGYTRINKPPKKLFCKGLDLSVKEVVALIGGRYSL